MAVSKKQKGTNGGDKARDILYTGVGFAAIAKEKVSTLVEELKKDGKLSKAEGEKIVTDFMAESAKVRDKVEKEVKDKLHDIMDKASATSIKDFDILKKRIMELESKGLSAIKSVLEGATKGGSKKSVAGKATAAIKKVVAAKGGAKGKVAVAKKEVKKAVKAAAPKGGVKAVAKKAVTTAKKEVKKVAPKAAVKKAVSVAKKAVKQAAPKTAVKKVTTAAKKAVKAAAPKVESRTTAGTGSNS